MRIWVALIVTPILALANQSISFGMVSWACTAQDVGALHAVHLAFLATALALPGMAGRGCAGRAGDRHAAQLRAGQRFLAGLATASALLSSLTIAAMWIPTWLLS